MWVQTGALTQYSDFPDSTCNYGVKSRSSQWRVCLVFTQTHFLWTPVKPRCLKHVCKPSCQWPTCSFAERTGHMVKTRRLSQWAFFLNNLLAWERATSHCPNSLTQNLFKPQPLFLSDKDACKRAHASIHLLDTHLLNSQCVGGMVRGPENTAGSQAGSGLSGRWHSTGRVLMKRTCWT